MRTAITARDRSRIRLDQADVLQHADLVKLLDTRSILSVSWLTMRLMPMVRPLEYYGNRNFKQNNVVSCMLGYTVGDIQPADAHCDACASVVDPASNAEPVFFECVSVVANNLPIGHQNAEYLFSGKCVSCAMRNAACSLAKGRKEYSAVASTVEVSPAPPSTPVRGQKRSAPSSAPSGSVASGLRSKKQKVPSSPRRSKQEELATGGTTIVKQDASFHFVPTDKKNSLGGGTAQFEWDEDNMLEVRVPAFETREKRDRIITRLLQFVIMLLDANDLRASDEFPKRITPVRPKTSSSSQSLTKAQPSPNRSPSVHRQALLESAGRAAAFTPIPLLAVAA
ncbi:hypothetical protein LTR99_011148 [Exophiala xenobiotica]|uniref:Uncharacterized protein n=1 Tax=Vermiconidia calcicola TaxID=1690605 RepID=A0AAV9PPQ4_9PEZI|nr:hypothetical protein LTR99_011148 [Exophiala xenobiotica]KAK5527501.1 hypothetical protein LTR25_011133 [Vermiconidia calcicola]KAK5528341.1 hypothetical protein LTR23_011044 [Chaetothyriales sp. CCFEE 6169]KAK5311067.1 hypothetical protein LTR93_011840 [Exophiala xenobiotica]KAK5399964.1 hypothetical protein LTR06_011380 [Exophiala xenobiotica]